VAKCRDSWGAKLGTVLRPRREGGESDEGDGGDPYSDEEMDRREQFLLAAVPLEYTSTVPPLTSGQEGPPAHKRSISAPHTHMQRRDGRQQTADSREQIIAGSEHSAWGV
jgi:hypothetical protein